MDWDSEEISSILDRALAEDIGDGDITTRTLLPKSRRASAVFLAKQRGVLAGVPLISRIFKRLDSGCRIQELFSDGSRVRAGTVFCKVSGTVQALLAGERLALNFLQRLSAIATQTAIFAGKASRYGITVLDTRKTTPLLRILEKYAVTAGGGKNHRAGLYDAVLVKDNHLRMQPDFDKLLNLFQQQGYSSGKVEIEVTSPAMLKSAIAAGASCFLLDNMSPSMIRKCIQIKPNTAYYEVSGGISAKNFSHYLIRGVDAISIGALTHSVQSLDLSMEIETP